MSVIIRDGVNAGHLAAVDPEGNLSVVVSGSLAAGSNLIGQVELSDGTNVIGVSAHPLIVSSAPASDRTATGTISSSPVANVAISTQGGGTILFNITGTWSGTLSFEASVDGTNWVPAVALPKYPSGSAATSTTTTNGQWAVNVGGLNMFRVRGSAWTSGTATVWLEVGQGTNVLEIFQFYSSNLLTDINASGTALTATGSALDVNIASGSVSVGGTVAVTQSTSPWVVSGTVTANQGTSPWVSNVSQFGGSAVVTGTGTSGAGIPRVTVSNDSKVQVWDGTNTASVTAKGTQGSEALAVQSLKDSGRTYLVFFIDAVTGITTEALATMTINNGGSTSSATSYTVTSGKTLRLQQITVAVQETNSTVQHSKIRVRSAGTVSASSPVIYGTQIATGGATNQVGNSTAAFPDGMEIAAGQQIGISHIEGTTSSTVTVTLMGYEY